jgi:hypothetical protein
MLSEKSQHAEGYIQYAKLLKHSMSQGSDIKWSTRYKPSPLTVTSTNQNSPKRAQELIKDSAATQW